MLHPLLVFVGGGLGCVSRYAVGVGIARFWPASPTTGAADPPLKGVHTGATLAVNVIGCVLIGLVWGRLGAQMREETRLLLVVGFLGGFTTFSAIGWETVTLLTRGHAAHAGAYVAATLLLGTAGAWAGHAVGLRLAGG
jgi:CrcB protein